MGIRIGVLVIADALELRKSLRQSLESRGFLVCEACAESDGLQTIDEGFQAQLVIADMDIPGMKSFRAGVSGRDDIRIIALNEQNGDGGRGASKAAVRPFDDLLFEDAIRSVAQEHRGGLT
jgi:CheY-like chemotaxis protein